MGGRGGVWGVGGQEELKPWFEHMEHRMAHVHIPAQQDDGGDRPAEPQRPRVQYKYHFHVLELHPDVCALVEAVIWDNARPVDPWAETAVSWTAQDMHQVGSRARARARRLPPGRCVGAALGPDGPASWFVGPPARLANSPHAR